MNPAYEHMLRAILWQKENLTQEQIDALPAYPGSIKPVGDDLYVYNGNEWVEISVHNNRCVDVSTGEIKNISEINSKNNKVSELKFVVSEGPGKIPVPNIPVEVIINDHFYGGDK